MKMNTFLESDIFQVKFPEYQDERIRNFANFLSKILGDDIKITYKATYDHRKRNLKDKDILFIDHKKA